MTVGELCSRYDAWSFARIGPGKDEITPGQYKGIVSRLKVFLYYTSPKLRVEKFTVDHLEEFFARVRPEFSAHYVAGIGRTIRAAFRWGAKRVPGRDPIRLFADNPIAGYDFPRAPKSVRGYVESDVIRRFLRWAWARARRETALQRRFDRIFILMLRFQRLTGCRPGEACDLRWTDVKPDGRIVIPAARQKTGKKTEKDRVIYLTPPVSRILAVLERLQGHHPTHVFPHTRGKGASARGHLEPLQGEPWPSGSSASAKVRKLRDAAIEEGVKGIEEVGPKKLVAYQNRHGYASDMIAMGKSHEQAARLLGNTAAVVSQTYSHNVTDRESELARDVATSRRRKS